MSPPCPSPKPKQVCFETRNMSNIKIVAFVFLLKNIVGKAVFHILNKNLARPYHLKLGTERLVGWRGANTALRSTTPTAESGVPGCPGSWGLLCCGSGFIKVPPLLPGYLTAWEQRPHKNIFDSLFLNSFYVVNGIIFTTFFCLFFVF